MERLTSEGYRCLAPDQRGYSPGARPADVDAYRYECLVDDVCALAAAVDMSFEFAPVDTPTLLLWGRNDRYIRRRAVDLAVDYMTGPYKVVELEAGQCIVQQAPAAIEAEVLAHLKAHPV
jgi:pimeloyl-ACP methyl ester carboxylesterase